MATTFKHWWLALRCSSIGTVMGLVPGLGSTAAAFVAYGHAKQTSKSSETFGQGNVEGVIAAESANDAVEGGALASTLAFGIPGSSSMAIVLAGLFVLGLQTGPAIVSHHTDLIFVMIFTVIVGNLFGTIAGAFLVNPLARLTSLPAPVLVPVLIAIIFTGAYAVNSSIFDIGIVVVFGVTGYLMKYLGYSRSSLLIGFVLGAVLEKNLFLAIQINGPYFILEPVPLALSVVTIGFLLYNLWAISRSSANGNVPPSAKQGKPLELYFISAAGIIFALSLLIALSYDTLPAMTPVFILLPLLLLTALQINRSRIIAANTGSSTKSTRPVFAGEGPLGKVLKIITWTVLLLGLIVIAGHYAGILIFMFLLLKMESTTEATLALAIAASVTLVLYILFEMVFDTELYRGLLYRLISGYKLF